MVHIVKAYLKPEIRRIAVTGGVISHYNALCGKLLELFPSLHGKCFMLRWKDEEGDDIVMSSDEELAQAVASAQDGVIKIYIHLTESDSSSSATDANGAASSGQAHPGVICDACNKEICGYRYKCLQCKDYDLCEGCNRLDKHPGHDMLKMAQPATDPRKWHFLGLRRMWQSMFGFHPFGGKFHCGKNSRRGHHPFGQANSENAGPSHFHHKCEEAGQELLQFVGQSVANLLDAFGVDVKVYVEPGSEDQEKPKASTSAKEGGKESAADDSSGSSSSDNEPQPSTSKDASTSAAPGETSDKKGAASAAEAEGTSKSDTADESEKQTKTAKDVFMEYCAQKNDTDGQKSSDSGCEASSTGTQPKSVPPPPLYPNVPVFNSKTYQDLQEVVKFHAQKALEKLGRHLQPHDVTGSPDDWTFVNPEPADSNTVPKAPEHASAAQGSSEPTAEKKQEVPKEKEAGAKKPEEAFPLDPAVANALQQMLAMGYNNEANWLAKLLKAKNGNINAVLDSLYK